MPLPSAQRDMLRRIAEATDARGCLMLQVIWAAGGREGAKLQRLCNEGLVEYCDLKLSRDIVDGIRITAAGRLALGSS